MAIISIIPSFMLGRSVIRVALRKPETLKLSDESRTNFVVTFGFIFFFSLFFTGFLFYKYKTFDSYVHPLDRIRIKN